MRRMTSLGSVTPVGLLALTLILPISLRCSAKVLDNFNDNIKTGWTDYPATDQLPIPPVAEQNQQFFFDIPPAFVNLSAAGLYTASVKTTEEFAIAEGRTVEFRVDLVQGTGDDAYAVLAYVPNGVDPKQTIGYSFAKSANEILLVKALEHYFLDDDTPTGIVKHSNVTMVLSLTGRGGNVVMTAKILDKDANDAVLWERTVVDTTGADFGNEGELGAAQAPFIQPSPLGTGRFALFMYAIKRSPLEEAYQVTFDNAETFVVDTTVLDDFDDNTKTSWTDYPATDQLPIPPVAEQNQQFFFDIPQAFVGLSSAGLYTASVKTSKEFSINEGDRLEFRVDLVEGTGDDAYAVLAYVPNGLDPKQTIGYSFAKSANEILLVKALEHYFLDDDTPTGTVKHANVTMVLSLTGRGGHVVMNAKVLDKDASDAVLWERTVVDTAGADFGNEGELGAAQAPFIQPSPLGTGRFSLYMYAIKREPLEDVYQATFDNAAVAASVTVANQPPIINNPQPPASAIFLPVSTVVSFGATDDGTLSDDQLSITLNGTTYTIANGLVVTGAGGSKTASLSGHLAANTDYVAVFKAEDAQGLVKTETRYFDTFAGSNLVVEVEDYDFGGGSSFNAPVPIPEGSGPQDASYSYQTGVPDVDYSDTRPTPDFATTLYRPNDNVRMQHSLDVGRGKFQDAGGAAAFVYDYEVGDIAAGEWLNYTRDFTAGSYEVYLRESLLLMDDGRSELQLVTTQNTNVLGSFLGKATGLGSYRNFALTDGSGLNKIVVRLAGRTTLRLHQITADADGGGRVETYLVFVPVADPGIQRATVSEVNPANGSTLQSAFLTVSARILNRDTTVQTATVKLQLNGQEVPATVTPTADGATVSYLFPGVPPANVVQAAKVSFQDNLGVEISSEWSFTLLYLSLDPANARAGTGKDSGFRVRVVQAFAGLVQINSPAMAEQQLALQLPDALYVDTSTALQVINLSQGGQSGGYFVAPEYPETLVPGLDDFNGTDDFTVEMKAWLQLKAGGYRFGVVTDDGYKMTSGNTLDNKTAVLGLNDGTSNFTIDFVAPVDGLYPFRMIWYERGGDAHGEWFSVDPTTGVRTLINDAQVATSIKAFRDIIAPEVQLESSSTVNSGYAVDASASVNPGTKTITVNTNGNARFYRLKGIANRISSVSMNGTVVTITYE